jgi:hypothetical protein
MRGATSIGLEDSGGPWNPPHWRGRATPSGNIRPLRLNCSPIGLASPCLKRSMAIKSINWTLPHRARDHYGLYWLSSQRADGPVLDYHFDYNVCHLNHRPAWLFRFDYSATEEE